MYGKKHSESTRDKIKEKRKLQIITEESRQKMSISHKERLQKYNHWVGRKHTEEACRKMSAHWARMVINNKWAPSYNSLACKVIDAYGEVFGYNFQHALNGGEYFIEQLGYWVDGYDVDKNTVIEYYERGHIYTEDKDKLRIARIKEELGCEVIILKEWVETDFKLINEILKVNNDEHAYDLDGKIQARCS